MKDLLSQGLNNLREKRTQRHENRLSKADANDIITSIMLKLLRKKGVAKKILWVIAIVIILSFGFFGTAYLLTGRETTSDAGKIFGRNIPLNVFNDAYQQVRIQAIIRFGDKFRDIAQFLDLEAQTWDRLILLREAKKRKIKITDQDVIKGIQQYPFFQRDGRFDPQLYNDVLRYAFRVTARDFEEGIRDNLKLIKLFEGETASAHVSDKEIFEAYQKQNEKIQVSYILVSADQFKNEVSFQEEEAMAYYSDNKSEFLIPAMVKVEYISLDFPEETPQEPESASAKEDQGKEKTSSPAVSEDAKKTVRDKAQEIFKKLLISPDMQKIALEHNLTVQTSNFFSMEQPDLSLGWSYEHLNKIFQLGPNEVKDPFETPTGIVIVQMKEKKEAYVPQYPEAKEKNQDALLRNKAKSVAKQKTDEYLQAILKTFEESKIKDFPKTAKNMGLEIHQTPAFARGEYLPQIGISKEFQEAAFHLSEENKLSEVVEVEKGFSILHLDTSMPADKDEFEKQKETLTASILDERKNQLFNEFLTRSRLGAMLEDHISKLKNQPTRDTP